MSDQTEPKCTAYHATVPPEATGRIRYVQRGGREVISNPLCDWHQGEGCTALRPDERRGEIREVGAVPLDCRERMAQARHAGREQRIAERTRDLMDEIVSVELHPINLDPYPGTVGDVADEIARYVLELDASGVANGLLQKLSMRLVCPVTQHPTGHLFPYVCVMMRGHGGDHVDPVTGAWTE